MLLATGVILLQLSSVMPVKAVKVKPAPVLFAASVPARSAETLAQRSSLPLSNVRLTDLNFDAAPDTPSAAPLPGTTPDAASITPIHVPQIKPPKNIGIESAEQFPRRTWMMLAIAQHGAAAFDAYTTRYAVGHGAVEQNPLMRPFVHSDSIYAVSQITPVIMDLVSRRMMRSQNAFIRHMWFVPQTLSFGTYVFAGVHNLHVAGRQ